MKPLLLCALLLAGCGRHKQEPIEHTVMTNAVIHGKIPDSAGSVDSSIPPASRPQTASSSQTNVGGIELSSLFLSPSMGCLPQKPGHKYLP